MAKYIIEGGNKLNGRVSISGNKNAALPCLAACLLTSEEVVLHNMPKISDVEVSIKILEELGAEVQFEDHTVKVSCKNISHTDLPSNLAEKLRASLLFVGALIGRFGEVEFPHPGGCVLGKRDFDLHLSGFKQMGSEVEVSDHKYKIKRLNEVTSEVNIYLENIATVTGTENLILASVLRQGKTTIRNAAKEPHVVDLCNLLVLMGANISGVGSDNLTIEGVKSLHGAEFTIGSDGIELGTYAIAAAITGGEIEIDNCQNLDLDPLLWPLKKVGVALDKNGYSIKVTGQKLGGLPKIITNVWPGFPTDLMSGMIVLSTQTPGVSLMHDWIYESRMFFVDKLITMGANITIADPHRVLVYGPTPLSGKKLESPDLRAGMALVLAALVAEGQSVIDRAELIDRGYENVVEKLSSLGAKIQKVEN